ncbi:MAG: ATP-binding protein [Prolixibacteraceae bacterium]|nr:ATP-binding protein [Prolixibacteraceae bacterium]
MIDRILKNKILELRDKFPVLTLTGPRQSGKTTLLKTIYTDIPYVNLEDIDVRNFAINDPRGFLGNYPQGAVFDEAQRVPQLFSYIQNIVDEKDVHFVLSGSQNFLMLENITQTLAGRATVLKLLPFSLKEIESVSGYPDYENYIYTGFYPRIYDKKINPVDFYPSYISTYIERDVRQIKNIENLNSFIQFIHLCAGRTGQLLNINSLATDAGISPNTAKSWLSVLEASYILYFLQPYYKNFNKRITKAPKLYFYDTGLVCSLLNIETAGQLRTHYHKGALFENFIINEFVKYRLNLGLQPNYYYWQNKEKKEIDLLIERASESIPIKIKSGKTMQKSFMKNLQYWKKLTGDANKTMHVIYGGDKDFITPQNKFISWKSLTPLIETIWG